jgi:alpha-beta hydrolase superfamily lysophospholipase
MPVRKPRLVSNDSLPDHVVWGDGQATIFLLHGMYGAKECWAPQAERLVAQGYRVVAGDAPTRRGRARRRARAGDHGPHPAGHDRGSRRGGASRG